MTYDLWVDFQRMNDDGRLPARARNSRSNAPLVVGSYIVVGSEDAEPAVARILAVDPAGAIQLQVLDGPIQDHKALVSTTA